MPSLLKCVWKNTVQLKFKNSTKSKASHTNEIIHEKCFNLIKNRKEIKQTWKIDLV